MREKKSQRATETERDRGRERSLATPGRRLFCKFSRPVVVSKAKKKRDSAVVNICFLPANDGGFGFPTGIACLEKTRGAGRQEGVRERAAVALQKYQSEKIRNALGGRANRHHLSPSNQRSASLHYHTCSVVIFFAQRTRHAEDRNAHPKAVRQ